MVTESRTMGELMGSDGEGLAKPIAIYYEHRWFLPLFQQMDARGVPWMKIDARYHQYDAASRGARILAAIQSHEPIGVAAWVGPRNFLHAQLSGAPGRQRRARGQRVSRLHA